MEIRYVVCRLYENGQPTNRVILMRSSFKPGAKEARHYGTLIEQKGGGWKYLTQIVLDNDIVNLTQPLGETDERLFLRTGLDFRVSHVIFSQNSKRTIGD